MKFQSSIHLRLQGYEQFKWQKKKVWQQFKTRLKETYSKLELWRKSLKKIEGNFGTGVVAYFLFLKWLMFLNLVIFLLIFSFVVLPTILIRPETKDDSNKTRAHAYSGNETSDYDGPVNTREQLEETTTDIAKLIQDLIQGTGDIGDSIMFYGKYTNETLRDPNGIVYNLPLAYILVTIALFLISLIAIVKSAAKGFKERLVEGEGQFYHYCNLVFGGWDFCINNEKSAMIKHKALYNEIKACLEAKRMEDDRRSRSRQEKTKLIIIRTFVNIIILGILGGSMVLIIYVFQFSNNELQKNYDNNYFELLLQFLPSLCITGLNIIVPIIFRSLTDFEHYSPLFMLRLTLLRTIILKLVSLGVLVYTLYTAVSNVECPDNTTLSGSKSCRPNCWETYVGQQIYKLVITDFSIHVVTTFFVNFPRSIIAKKFDNKFAKFIGEQQYDLPKNVLDVIYSQTLCWLGAFFAPLLPAVATVIGFFMFYIKKFVCLVNSTPSSNVYRASRSNSMFMFVLLIAHCLAVIPVALSIAEIKPSENCGPFRGNPLIWNYVIDQFEKLPEYLRNAVFLIGTAWFTIPVFIILVLCLYYYSAVTDANKHMVEVLKNQLILEGHDKQFLLNRLVEFTKQQQEQMKRLRLAEMQREHNRVTASQ